MTNDSTTAIGYVGSVPWGTHFCEFYRTDADLAEALVPYITTGIHENQFCVWVASDPSGVEGIKTRLRRTAPHLDRYLNSGQIEIWDSRDWYLRGGHFDADRVLGQWVDKERRSLDSGYDGLRVTGDMSWLEKGHWPDFMAYEAEVNRVLSQRRVIGLCTYPLDGCQAEEAISIIRNHQFVLGGAGECEQLGRFDSATAIMSERLRIQKTVCEQLERLSAHLIERQDQERRCIAGELHEVTAQNVAALNFYLASLRQRESWPSEVELILAKCHSMCKQSLEQILELSHRMHPPTLDRFGLTACLSAYIEDFMVSSDIHIEFKADPEIGRLSLKMETHLFRIAQQALSNILRHSGSPNAVFRLEKHDDQIILQVEDFGQGMRAALARGFGEVGLGILEVQERLRKIEGHLEIRSNDRGTVLTAIAPLSERLRQ